MSNDESKPDLNDELLSAYVDGELSPELRAQVEERLRTDPQARRLVDDMRALSGAIQALPREKFTGDLRPRVWAGVDEAESPIAGTIERAPRDRWAGFRRGLAWSAVAIAATLVLMIVQPEEQGDNREIARVDAASEPEAEAKSAGGESAPRLRRGPPEMGAAMPADGADGSASQSVAATAPPTVIDAPAATEDEAAGVPSAETLAAVAGDLADQSAAPEATAALSALPGEPVAASRAPARPTTLATVDVTASAPSGMAQLEAHLAEHRIEVSEPGEEEMAASGLAPLAPGETALLVEASPAQLVAVYDALRADRQQFADVRIREDRPGARDVRGGALAEGRGFAKSAGREAPRDRRLNELLADEFYDAKSPAAAAGQPSAPGRAWRLPSKDETPAAKLFSAKSGAPARSAPLAAPRTADGVATDKAAPTSRQVRVLFVLRAPERPVAPAAPSPAAARPE